MKARGLVWQSRLRRGAARPFADARVIPEAIFPGLLTRAKVSY
jgi:hypothetical protein